MSVEIAAIVVAGVVLVVMLALVFRARPLSVALIDEAIDFADAEAEKARALGHNEQGGNVRLLNATRYLQKRKKSLPQHVARAAIIHRKAQKP